MKLTDKNLNYFCPYLFTPSDNRSILVAARDPLPSCLLTYATWHIIKFYLQYNVPTLNSFIFNYHAKVQLLLSWVKILLETNLPPS